VFEGLQGVPLLNDCLAHFECAKVACHVEGDHAIFIGRVERYASAGTDRLPLVFCQGGYMAPQLLAAA
jgi:flavin reductase (DIM6/NTAB) family NADH-FMN oxidoreductase RutF